MFIVVTVSFTSSYISEDALSNELIFFKTVKERGAEAIESNFMAWLNETIGVGCEDDIVVPFVYNRRCIECQMTNI